MKDLLKIQKFVFETKTDKKYRLKKPIWHSLKNKLQYFKIKDKLPKWERDEMIIQNSRIYYEMKYTFQNYLNICLIFRILML